MTTSPLSELRDWLAPAAMGLDQEVLSARQTAVTEIAERFEVLDLAAIAHGLDIDAVDGVEEALAEADSSWLMGEGPEILRRIASAALIRVLRRSDTQSLVGALAAHSAEYLGGSCPVDEVSRLASEVVAERTARARARNDFHAIDTKSQRLLYGQDTIQNKEGVDAVRALARRFNEIVADMQARIALLDEEVDALWWARRRISATTQERWESMSELRRSIVAAEEIIALCTELPPARGTLEVLQEAIGSIDPDLTVTLAAAANVLIATQFLSTTRTHLLLPLTSAATIMLEYSDDLTTASRVLRQATGTDLDSKVPVAGIGAQLIYEAALIGLLER